MVSAQPLAARRGGVNRLPSLGDSWLDDDAVILTPVERYRARQEVVKGVRRMGVDIVQVSTAGQVLTEWEIKTARPGRARSALTVTLPMPAELAEAIAEIDEVAAYAEEIEVEMPSAVAFGNAQRLLKAMYRVAPRRYSVYPMPDGYIAIDARGGKGRIAVVMCGSDGSVLCLVTIGSNHRRARYSAAINLPDGFIREALAEL